MDRNKTIDVLNGLIETCRDGQHGFLEASENISNGEFKSIFADVSLERARFVGELQQEVRALGGDPEDTGSTAAALHRAWIDIKGTFTGKDDQSILSECERGEDSAVAQYRDALKSELPSNLLEIVERQFEEVHRVHNLVKQYRDSYAKA